MFIGKATLGMVFCIDLLFVALVIFYYNKQKYKKFELSWWHSILFYFIQLFVLLLIAPIQPEGVLVNLSNYSSKIVRIMPVIKGKAKKENEIEIRVVNDRDKQQINFRLEHNSDHPKDYILSFGKMAKEFSVDSIQFYSSFFALKLPVIEISQLNIRNFLLQRDRQSQDHQWVEITQKRVVPDVVLFRISDEIQNFPVFSELIKRSLLWAVIFSLLISSVILFWKSTGMALSYIKNENRGLLFRIAYHYWAFCIVTCSVCVVVYGAEYSLRFYYRDILTTASDGNYFYNKSYKKFLAERNSHKFRGNDFSIEKTDSLRIVIMGDSITYGQGVYPYSLRYSDILEKKLLSSFPGKKFEVINLGVCGQNLPDYFHALSYALLLHPDYILYQWFINDMDYGDQRADVQPRGLIKNRYWQKSLLDNSVLYCLIQRGWYQSQIKLGRIEKYDQHIRKWLTDETAKASRDTMDLLNKLFNKLQESQIKFGVVLFPHLGYPSGNHPFAFMHDRISHTCEDRKIPFLDLRRGFAPFDQDLPKLWANRFDQHPSALAHTIAAQEIFNRFALDWKTLSENRIKTTEEKSQVSN